MQTFISNQVGRTFILKLEQGEDLIEGIESLIATHDVANAVILTGIATLDRISLNVVQGSIPSTLSPTTGKPPARWSPSTALSATVMCTFTEYWRIPPTPTPDTSTAVVAFFTWRRWSSKNC